MGIATTPSLTPDALRVFTGCHTPTGMRVLERCAVPNSTLAVGEPGPWMEQAQAMGCFTAPIDLLQNDGVDRLSLRLIDTHVRVFHPLTILPTGDLLRSTATVLAAIGRSGAVVERFVLGGSACVWRSRHHRWSVGDASYLPPAASARAGAYAACESLALRALPSVLTRLRSAPLWDATERGLATRLTRSWMPQPKQGRALLDPLMVEDWVDAVARAMDADARANGAVFGLPGPQALPAKALAAKAGAKVFAVPSGVSELLGSFKLFGWDRDTALIMAWTLTLSGSGAWSVLGWEAKHGLP